MKEALLTRLSLEDVKNLLGVQYVSGTPGQLERLRRWIESLVEKRGNTFVLENRRGLLDQWKRHMVLKNWDCC
jgi:hypothetical protein